MLPLDLQQPRHRPCQGKLEAILALSLQFSPVGYLTATEVTDDLKVITQNIRDNEDFIRGVDRPTVLGYALTMLLAAVLSLKHVSFREEHEWRAVYLPTLHPSPLMTMSMRDVGGLPQPIFEIPLNAAKDPTLAELDFPTIFNRLIIGPTQFGLPMYDALVNKLIGVGVPDAGNKVWLSNIPIRT
jgi:hypothetical protein